MASPSRSSPGGARSRPVAPGRPSTLSGLSTPSGFSTTNNLRPRPSPINRKTNGRKDGVEGHRGPLTPASSGRETASVSSASSSDTSVRSDSVFDTSTIRLNQYASAATTPDTGCEPRQDNTGTPCKSLGSPRVDLHMFISESDKKAEEIDFPNEGSAAEKISEWRGRQSQSLPTQCLSGDEKSIISKHSDTTSLKELWEPSNEGLLENSKPAAASESDNESTVTTPPKDGRCSNSASPSSSSEKATEGRDDEVIEIKDSEDEEVVTRSGPVAQRSLEPTPALGTIGKRPSQTKPKSKRPSLSEGLPPGRGELSPKHDLPSGHGYPAFSRFNHKKLSSNDEGVSQTDVNNQLYLLIKTYGTGEKFDAKEKSKSGFIYIFESPQCLGMVKIGKTMRSREERIYETTRTCKMSIKPVRDEQDRLVRHYGLVETLIHMELAEFRRKFTCPTCKNHPSHTFSLQKKKKGPKEHGEWFEVDHERALTTICRWRDWMVDCDPYDSEGRLKARWGWKLERYIKYQKSPNEFLKPFTTWEETAYFSSYTHQSVQCAEMEWQQPISTVAFLLGGLTTSVVALCVHETIGLRYGSWVAAWLSAAYFISKSRR